MSGPWICPKCGRVYGPSMMLCAECNARVTRQQERRPDGGTHHDYPDRPDRLR